MKLNKKQKKTIFISSMLVLLSLIAWQIFGGDIFTKTEVLIEKKDDLLGTSYKEWQHRFVLRLDYTLALISNVIFSTGFIIYKQRK
jgi:hypothetical protein